MKLPWRRSEPQSDVMPFLDHLDELRTRIIRSVIALVIGISLAFGMAMKVDFLGILVAPIEGYLPGNKLVALSPTEPFFITMRLAIYGGLLFSAPIIIQQLWLFVSPALTDREKRAIVPAFYLGLVLFILGVVFAYAVVLPFTLKFTMTFQAERLELMISVSEYLDIAIRLMLVLGLVFELPMVMLVLATIGIVNSRQLAEKRRFAVVLSVVVGALISPGDMIIGTIILALILLGLYELGILLARMVERRRERARLERELELEQV